MDATSPHYNEALTLALQLPFPQRLHLIAQLAASMEAEPEFQPDLNPSEHWGKDLLRLLETLDTLDWPAFPADDVVDWLKTQREDDLARLAPYWSDPE